MPVHTPWGTPDAHDQIQEGLDWFGTPSHGGYRVDTDLYKEACAKQDIPVKEPCEYDNAAYMWFEEDCDWGFVAIAFPEHFGGKEQDDCSILELAEKAIVHSYPEYWEKWRGRELKPGESMVKDRREFMKAHKGEYIETSTSQLVPGTTVIYATPDAEKNATIEHIYLVPTEKYIRADRECGGRHPYLPDGEDIFVTKEELADLKRSIMLATLKFRDDFAPLTIEEGSRDNVMELVCRRSAGGFYLDGIDRISLSIPKAEWEARDIKDFHIVRKDENGEWKLHNASEIEEESESPAP